MVVWNNVTIMAWGTRKWAWVMIVTQLVRGGITKKRGGGGVKIEF